MNKSLKNLQIQRLVQEYSFLLLDDEYKKEIVNTYQQEFLNLVNERIIQPEVIPTPKQEGDDQQSEKLKKEVLIDPENVSSETKGKVKKIFRDIAKLTHPDRVKDDNLVSLYIEAKEAYDNFDLFQLYFISNKLSITLDLGEEDIDVLDTLVNHKKNSLKNVESSFIWKWVHSKTDEEKEDLLNGFIDTHYKDCRK